MFSVSSAKRKVKPGFSLKNFAGKMVMIFAPVAGATKSTELLTNDTDVNAVDTHFTILAIDGLIN
jgi:hypothetical protein